MSLLYILFFVSGCAALLYELLWFRALGFIFGNTVHAAATVVAAFMTGLALGAFVLGRMGDRVRRPARVFAGLELGIAAYACAAPMLFHGVRVAYRYAYQHGLESLALLTPLRFALSFLVLLAPTFLMGATLPVLAQGLARARADFARRIGWLYGLNTLGGVVGVVSGGYLLLPGLGLSGTRWVAVACNVLAALLALAVADRAPAPAAAPAPAEPAEIAPVRSQRGLVLLATFSAGFIALGFEVLWFRTLTLIVGSTTYSFCLMLGVFLLGCALGSVLLGRWADRAGWALPLVAAAQAGIGVAAMAAMYLFNGQAEYLVGFLIRHGFTWGSVVTAQFLIASKFLLAPTLLMGLAFTAAVRALRSEGDTAAGSAALVYTLNTVGCVLGSAVAGFVLLPRFGIEDSLKLMAALALGVGVFLAVAADGHRGWRWLAVGLALLGVLVNLYRPAHWSRKLLAAGPYFSPWVFVNNGRPAVRERLQTERLIYYREGVTATASVTQTDDEHMYFSMDGKVEADTTPRGMMVQRLIGHLPMLFHPNPRRVMNLGLGAGVTFGALSCYPVDRLEVVEIEPAAVGVARVWSNLNHNVVNDPRATITINDGRNHFFCTTQRYDVITSDPFEPVVGGASHLFSVEHYEQAKACLAPGGIMGQWVPMYEMSERDFLVLLRSFVRVFPKSAVFFTGLDTILLGFQDELKLDAGQVRSKFALPAVRASLAEVGITRPEMILGMFVADMAGGRDFVGPGPLHTDQHPLIEFSVPKSAMIFTAERNQQILHDNFTAIPASLLAGFNEDEVAYLRRQNQALKMTLEASQLRAEKQADAAYQRLYEAYQLASDNPVIVNELCAVMTASALALQAAGQLQEASYQFQIVLQLMPHAYWPRFNLIQLAMQSTNRDFAERLLTESRSLYPHSPLMRMLSGQCEFAWGHWETGLKEMQAALRMAPAKATLWDEYGKMLEAAGRFQDAARAQALAKELARRF